MAEVKEAAVKLLGELISGQDRASLVRYFENFLTASRWLRELPDTLRDALRASNTIPHRELTLGDLRDIVSLAHTQGSEEAARRLNELNEALFKDPAFFKRLVSRWEKSRRWIVLKDILAAHEKGLFGTSVPAALAQAEGVVVDSLPGHRGSVRAKHVLAHVRRDADLNELYGDVIERFVTKFLLENFNHGEAVPHFSRHAILHGADITYAEESKSIKAILWLDFLMYGFGQQA